MSARVLPVLLLVIGIWCATLPVRLCFYGSYSLVTQRQKVVLRAVDPQASEVSRRHQAQLLAAGVAIGAAQEVQAEFTDAELLPETKARSITKEIEAFMKIDPVPNDSGAKEKHLPKVTLSGESVSMTVPHVMIFEPVHYIQYMWFADAKDGRILGAKAFQPTDASPPSLSTKLPKGRTAVPMLYCNLHGVWQGEPFTV